MDYLDTDSHYESRFDLDNFNDPDYYSEDWRDEFNEEEEE